MKLTERISLAKLTIAEMTFIFLGFMVLGISMKVQGYPDSHDLGIVWKPTALSLRQYGLLTLLVPVMFWGAGTYAMKDQTKLDSDSVAFGSILVTVVLMLTFIAYAVSPYTRPLWNG